MRCVGPYGIFGFDRRNGSFFCRRLRAPERPRQSSVLKKRPQRKGNAEAVLSLPCAGGPGTILRTRKPANRSLISPSPSTPEPLHGRLSRPLYHRLQSGSRLKPVVAPRDFGPAPGGPSV